MMLAINLKATHELVATKDIEYVNQVCNLALVSDNLEEQKAGKVCEAVLRRLGIRKEGVKQ